MDIMASPAGGIAQRGAPAGGAVLIDFELAGERIGHGRYRVSGGSQTHWVDLYTTAHPRCDCGDHLWRERICKHILAALLREGNDRVVAALGRLLGRWRESGGGSGPQPDRKAA